jgi:hypothetical protein
MQSEPEATPKNGLVHAQSYSFAVRTSTSLSSKNHWVHVGSFPTCESGILIRALTTFVYFATLCHVLTWLPL